MQMLQWASDSTIYYLMVIELIIKLSANQSLLLLHSSERRVSLIRERETITEQRIKSAVGAVDAWPPNKQPVGARTPLMIFLVVSLLFSPQIRSDFLLRFATATAALLCVSTV